MATMKRERRETRSSNDKGRPGNPARTKSNEGIRRKPPTGSSTKAKKKNVESDSAAEEDNYKNTTKESSERNRSGTKKRESTRKRPPPRGGKAKKGTTDSDSVDEPHQRSSSGPGYGQEEEEGEDENRQFDFFYKHAKSLVLKLTDKERVRGFEWLAYLKNHKSAEFSVNLMIVFIMCLGRRRLIWPFNESPEKSVKSFDQSLAVEDICRLVLKVEQGGAGKPQVIPPILSSISADTKEYAAVQEIPKFGVQCYYATSNEPISEWLIPKSDSLPSAEQMKLTAWDKCLDMLSQCVDPVEPLQKETGGSIEREKCTISSHALRDYRKETTSFRWAERSRLSARPEALDCGVPRFHPSIELDAIKADEISPVELKFGEKVYITDADQNSRRYNSHIRRNMYEGEQKERQEARSKLGCRGSFYDFVQPKLRENKCASECSEDDEDDEYDEYETDYSNYHRDQSQFPPPKVNLNEIPVEYDFNEICGFDEDEFQPTGYNRHAYPPQSHRGRYSSNNQ